MTKCPQCAQKLMMPESMLVGAKVICPNCGRHLRISSRTPDSLELLGENASLTKDAKPESYA